MSFLRPQLTPQTAKMLRRFRELKRGYYSFIALVVLTGVSLVLELLINSRAIVVSYQGRLYFPTYARVHLGAEFGLAGSRAQQPVDYRELNLTFMEQNSGNWVLMPPVPYDPLENSEYQSVFKPAPPGYRMHWLGTDSTGRDILARLAYGFRTALFFAIIYTLLVYVIGVAVGCAMGYLGGWFDLVSQRLVEIWSQLPFLYIVIIAFSLIPSELSISMRIGLLLMIMVAFSWTGMTYYMRTTTYREKARDYVNAATVLGASTGRVIFRHILPNTLAVLVTFMPFTVSGAITAVTALDFLGFGLPVPTPSIGEILKQGTERLDAPWIVTSAFVTLVVILTLITFIGEAIREAFDPKKFTTYQ
jgi:microcin C transport system permease protein